MHSPGPDTLLSSSSATLAPCLISTEQLEALSVKGIDYSAVNMSLIAALEGLTFLLRIKSLLNCSVKLVHPKLLVEKVV